jgi:acyl-CoA dehydrogenase
MLVFAGCSRDFLDGVMSAAAESVSDEDFAQIREATRAFVRNKVVPRELEIMETDAIPDDIRRQAAEMGLFGYAIPQEWAVSG